MNTIAIINQKGGVGKTTLTFNLSKGLATKYRVLAIDNDPQGNLTSAFLNDPEKLKADILDIYQNKEIQPEKIEKNLHLLGSTIHLSKIADSDFEVVFKLKEGIEEYKKTI